MKNPSTASTANRPCAFLWIIVATMLIAPPSTFSQTYGLRYHMTIGTTDNQTQNSSYESGLVQTNSLTANLGDIGAKAAATATPTVSYGPIHLTALCSVNNPTWDGNGHLARMDYQSGSPLVFFTDTLTVTSATLPPGTPVTFQFALRSTGYITPGADGGLNATTSSAYVQLSSGSFFQGILVPMSGALATNTSLTTVNLTVGSTINFVSAIGAIATAGSNGDPGFVGAVNTDISSQVYVDVLTQGVNYSAASGTDYPRLILPPPILKIRYTNNMVIVWWPSEYSDYSLKQNTNLNSATWASNTNAISQVGSDNQIIVTPPVGAMFYRLQK